MWTILHWALLLSLRGTGICPSNPPIFSRSNEVARASPFLSVFGFHWNFQICNWKLFLRTTKGRICSCGVLQGHTKMTMAYVVTPLIAHLHIIPFLWGFTNPYQVSSLWVTKLLISLAFIIFALLILNGGQQFLLRAIVYPVFVSIYKALSILFAG